MLIALFTVGVLGLTLNRRTLILTLVLLLVTTWASAAGLLLPLVRVLVIVWHQHHHGLTKGPWVWVSASSAPAPLTVSYPQVTQMPQRAPTGGGDVPATGGGDSGVALTIVGQGSDGHGTLPVTVTL